MYYTFEQIIKNPRIENNEIESTFFYQGKDREGPKYSVIFKDENRIKAFEEMNIKISNTVTGKMSLPPENLKNLLKNLRTNNSLESITKKRLRR